MDEAGLWRKIRPLLIDAVGGRWDRVENGVSAGMPDVNYCINGREGWLELKAARTFPTRNPNGPVFAMSANHPLLLSQINWHLKQDSVGGSSFIFAYVPVHGMFLVHGSLAADFNQMSLRELRELSLWSGVTVQRMTHLLV